MINKKDLRRKFKEQRQALQEAGQIALISEKISNKIENLEIFKKAKNVLVFYPKGSELDVLRILKKDKNFFLPRCKGKEIEVCPYKAGDKLEENVYGIKEPLSEALGNLSALDLVIVPALCAGENFHRTGYGGGFYDRFFKRKDLRAKKVVIVPDCALIKKVPSEPFDVKCDIIITEKRELF